MELFVRTRILDLPPQAIPKIKASCNLEKPGRMDEAIDVLEKWIQKQAHISKKDFISPGSQRTHYMPCRRVMKCLWLPRTRTWERQSRGCLIHARIYRKWITSGGQVRKEWKEREYFARTLIMSKGSIEKAKKQIEQLCTMKTLLPHFFTKTNLKTEMKNFVGLLRTMVPLPIVTEDFYRVMFLKPNKISTEENIFNFYQYTIILSEYLKAHDFVNGFIMVNDFQEADIADLITKVNLVQMQQFVSILVEGFGARIKGVYVITQSKVIYLLIKMVKQFLSQKLASRLHVVKTVEELHKVVPKDILPEEYGGKERPFITLVEDWIEELSSKEHVEYMKMMNKACTNENLRNTDQFNQEYMGTPGSFRRLTVD